MNAMIPVRLMSLPDLAKSTAWLRDLIDRARLAKELKRQEAEERDRAA